MAIGAVSKKGQYIVVNGVLCLGLAQVPVSVRPFISARITAVMVGEIATAVFCLLIMLWIFARVRGNLRKHVQWVFYEVEGVLSILLAITFYISVDLDVGWIRFLLYSAFVLPLCGIVFLAKEFLKQRRNFLVLLLFAGLGVGAVLLKVMVPLLFCIAVGLEAGGLVMALPRWAQQPASPSPSAHPRNRGRNVLAGFSLAILFVVPMVPFMVPLYDQSTVVIRLDSPMYTVTGEAVTTVALRPRTAMILLNDPHTTATPGPELIRPAKTVRLAAYLYVIANSTVDECVTWVGNNLDVYSLNLCGWVLSPGNVSAMKSLNPAGRFYFMVWGATTLFEDANSTYPPGEWNPWSQTAWVKFNDTMLGWTLKLKDGSEAIGINRKNSTDAAHVMDLGKMEWADYFAWIYTNRAKQYHADGLAIDEVMWRGYWGVDLATLRDYTSLDEIEATCYQWLARVDQKTDLEVITQAYWPEAQESQDGVWGETAFGYVGRSLPDDRYNVVWYEANNWEGVVHDLEAKGQQNDTYIWAAWYHQDDPAEREYAVATYLMGKQNGILSVGFHPQPIYGAGYDPDVAGHPGTNFAGYSVRTAIDEVQSHPELFDLELGDAAGPMYLLSAPGGQYWRRDFENGIVVVNSFHQSIPWSRGDTGFDSDRDGIDDAIELEHGSSRFDDNDFPVMLVVGPPLAASAAVLGVLLGSMLYKRRKPVGGLPGTAARNENLP